MANESTTIHGPTATAPTVSNKYATCVVCGIQWQVKSDADRFGCHFCNADRTAVTIHNEDPK
jgi:hypothetical protein